VATAQGSAGVDAACCDRVADAPALHDEQVAAMAKAIGHPARLRILRVLAARDDCITGDVVAELGLAQSTVSEHLRILRAAGLIHGDVDGPRTRYCIRPEGLAAFKAAVASL
jgi:ArsR family transcriptional regulator, arsenate/arsenite/antimonite-responsive transcriptional repressor